MNAREEWGQAIAREISHSIARKIATGIAFFLMFLLFITIGGFVVQLLWNWLLPDIFQLRRITVWEALGLLALCRILFGGFGKGGGTHSHSRRARRRGDADQAWWKSAAPQGGGGAAPPPPTVTLE
jgi:hypothetical protein